ncbi:MAG: hypothetical protein ACLGHN_06160 [Bacteriovoracia bacterium]
MNKRYYYLLITLLSVEAWAGPKEAAWKLHNRLTGVPPVKTATTDPLREMELAIAGGRPEEAAEIAVNHPNFYNIVLKNWIKPWSNREQTSRTELNDYVATIIGIIRDDVPFTEVLSGDIIYTVNGSPSPYSVTNNDHYEDAEDRNINLMTSLMRQTQSALTGLPASAVSGVITTRAAGEAFFSAGTNRRINRFNFINYLCRDYEELHDVNIADFRVRRDVERNPGGDSRTYRNKCVGCHAGQDALGGAYAYYDFVGGQLVYTPGIVVSKMNHNVYYKDGFVTTDDSWINTWAQGQNAVLGWRGPTQGRGVKELGQMLSRSKAFSQCMARKVFKVICLKDAINTDDVNMVDELASRFEQDNYNMKQLFINTSVGCIVNEDES